MTSCHHGAVWRHSGRRPVSVGLDRVGERDQSHAVGDGAGRLDQPAPLDGGAAGVEQGSVVEGELGISRYAVDFHERHILRKFKASTRLTAVIKAIGSGFLPLECGVCMRR